VLFRSSEMGENDAIEAAQRSDTLVHFVLIGLVRGKSMDVARRIAGETGGREMYITQKFRLENAFDEISNEMRTEYSLGYYPTDSKQDGKYRHLKIEVTNKDYKVQAREGYFARKAEK